MTHPDLVSDLRKYLHDERTELLKIQSHARMGRNWLKAHTAVIDLVLARIYEFAWDNARATLSESERAQMDREGGLTLVAIGGYGRGELCPHSDIDIAFLAAEEENHLLNGVVKEAFRLIVEILIDGEKLDVSYSYRPLIDMGRLDPKDKTSLLDARLIAGSPWLIERALHDLHDHWDGVEYLLDKERERRQVGRQIEYSMYGIEPHLKEGSGMLRDLQSALWVTAAMLETREPMRELEWRGIVTGEDCQRASAARDWMLSIRTWLHLVEDRKTDVLRVDLQDRCARWRGFTGIGAIPSQLLLGEGYKHAEATHNFAFKVFRRLLDGALHLDDHFVARHQRVNCAHPYMLSNHPELLIAPFAQARKYGFGLDSELDRAVEEALPLVTEKTRTSPIARAGLWSLLEHPETVAEALTELRERGVLQRFIPEFESMLRLAPADPSHRLTVGEHSLEALRQLGRMYEERNEDDEMFAVWSGVDDRALLMLGTLLHDVGKIQPGTDHAVSGEKLARKIGARLGLSGERLKRLGVLVRRHLLLPRTARLRDLNAPGTTKEVIKFVGDVSTLKMLYLLSIADTCAVGERTYSRTDLEGMREIYERTLLAMTREEEAEVLTDNEKREQMVQRERQRLRRELRDFEWDDDTLKRVTDSLPTSYVLNTPLTVIATHMKFLEQLPREKLIVDFTTTSQGNRTEMTVVTYDDAEPGLLSKICGVIHAIGAETKAAHVYTLHVTEAIGEGHPPGRDIVLDRLKLEHKGRALPEARCARLAAALREVIVGGRAVEDVIKAAGKEAHARVVPQRIEARNDLSDDHTVINVVSENTSGLLYAITDTLAEMGMDIHTAKITSWGGRAEDAFYVTCRPEDGNGLSISSTKPEDDDISELMETLRDRLIRAK